MSAVRGYNKQRQVVTRWSTNTYIEDPGVKVPKLKKGQYYMHIQEGEVIKILSSQLYCLSYDIPYKNVKPNAVCVKTKVIKEVPFFERPQGEIVYTCVGWIACEYKLIPKIKAKVLYED